MGPPESPPAASPARSAARVALRAVIALAVTALCVRVLSDLDAQATLRALLAAPPWRLALAALAHLAHLGFKSARWTVLLRPVARIPSRRILRYLLASNAAGAIAPTRAGDALWAWLLASRDGVPVAPSLAALLVEKLFEGLGLALLVAPLPWLLSLPPRLGWTVGALGFGGIAVSAAAVALARSERLQRWAARWSVWPRIAPALECLQDPSRTAACAALSVAGHLCDAAAIALLMGAAGASAHWASPGLVLLSVTAALTVPSTPASIGAFELAALAPLELLGVSRARALAFAVLFHSLHIPLVMVGALLAVPLLWPRGLSERRGDD